MDLKKTSLAALTLSALAAYGDRTKTSAPTNGAQQSVSSTPVPIAVTGLVKG